MFRFHNLLTRSRLHGLAVATGLLATTTSTLSLYPHSLAYFNEAAGGPLNGYRHLLGSNLDWGQDHLALRHLLDASPGLGPLMFVHTGRYSNQQTNVHVLPVSWKDAGSILRGYNHLAVSPNILAGDPRLTQRLLGPEATITTEDITSLFARQQPVAVLGQGSIYVLKAGPVSDFIDTSQQR